MSDTIIRVNGLGKRYRIARADLSRTFVEAVADAATWPVRRWRQGKDVESKRYGAFWACRNVSFEVKKGEVVGVIGRNGAGKSTLLKLLSRITEPTEGEAEIRGRVGSLLEVGTGFHPELSGRENIFLNGAILGMPKAEIARKFDEIVAFSDVEKFLDTPVKRYSSGMYTRLAFAVAAHLEPEVLIVDEVLAVGDAQFQKKCLGKMGDVAKQGRTILFVSHNMAAVQGLCNRGVVLKAGGVVFDGSSEDAVAHYLAGSTEGGEHDRPGHFDLSRHENHYRRVIFKSPLDQAICSFNTSMRAIESVKRGDIERLTLQIPRIPLLPGSYWIDLQVVQVQGKDSPIIDYVDRAAPLQVVAADVFGTGYSLTSRDGLVYMDGQWDLKPLDAA
ncbi:MAG: polysaccharide ABC transporter ATP-binding protein [Planctomycetota bacterium]|nr:polysaccharide ABC transporter ATP-binding protein [Planctomycetota bacterium]